MSIAFRNGWITMEWIDHNGSSAEHGLISCVMDTLFIPRPGSALQALTSVQCATTSLGIQLLSKNVQMMTDIFLSCFTCDFAFLN